MNFTHGRQKKIKKKSISVAHHGICWVTWHKRHLWKIFILQGPNPIFFTGAKPKIPYIKGGKTLLTQEKTLSTLCLPRFLTLCTDMSCLIKIVAFNSILTLCRTVTLFDTLALRCTVTHNFTVKTSQRSTIVSTTGLFLTCTLLLFSLIS